MNLKLIKWITKYLAFFVRFIPANASFILIIEIFIKSINLYNGNAEKGARGEGSERRREREEKGARGEGSERRREREEKGAKKL